MSNRIYRFLIVSLVLAVLFVGATQILAKKPSKKVCPEPVPGCQCPWYEDTVYCKRPGKKSPVCTYTNPCFARCAGFGDDQCSRALPQ